MLEALLTDRFNLKIHSDRKELPVYALTIAKKGPKLKQPAEAEQPTVIFRPSVQPNGEGIIQLIVKSSSIQELANTFSDVLGRPVLDRTGLKGRKLAMSLG